MSLLPDLNSDVVGGVARTAVNPLAMGVLVTAITLLSLQTPFLPSVSAAVFSLLGSVLLAAFLCWQRMLSPYVAVGLITVAYVLLIASRWSSQLLPASCEGRGLTVHGQVLGLPRQLDSIRESYLQIRLSVTAIGPDECAGPSRIRLYLPLSRFPVPGGDHSAIQAGDFLSVEARLRQPWGLVNPRSRGGERQFFVAGIHAVGSVVRLQAWRPNDSPGFLQSVNRWRGETAGWLIDSAPGESGPLLAALGVGDRRAMDEEHWATLRHFGLTHLLVISGLHVSLVALPGWYLGRVLEVVLSLLHVPIAGRMRLPVASALMLAASYSLLAGLSLPTLRALLMLILAAIPVLCGRPLDRTRSFGACMFTLCLLDPPSVLGPSFWLSLGAVGLLLWLSAWRRSDGVLRLFAHTQVYLVAAMLPLSLFWFGAASTVGAVINLVAIPLLTWCLLPVLIGALALRENNIRYASHIIEYIDKYMDIGWAFLRGWLLDGGATGLLNSSLPAGLLVCALIAALLYPLPGKRWKWVLQTLLIVPLGVNRIAVSDGDVQIRFLDVGQGTSVLVGQGNRYLLYDTGGRMGDGATRIERAAMPFLRYEGVGELQLLVISHPDEDHDGGETFVRETLVPQKVLRGVAPRESGELCRPGAETVLTPGVWIQQLSMSHPGSSDNSNSCVLMLHAHGRRLLFTGDIDVQRERELVAYWGDTLKADVLLIAHHGSNTSSSRLLLRSVDPRWTVITAGRANRFGHPTDRVRQIIREQGAYSLNTAYSGAVTFHVDAGGRIRCTRERHRFSPFWRRGQGNRNCGLMSMPAQV